MFKFVVFVPQTIHLIFSLSSPLSLYLSLNGYKKLASASAAFQPPLFLSTVVQSRQQQPPSTPPGRGPRLSYGGSNLVGPFQRSSTLNK